MTMDRYVEVNAVALDVLASHGHSPRNGVSRSTIRAFARRGLVWDKGDGRAVLTKLGEAKLVELSQSTENTE